MVKVLDREPVTAEEQDSAALRELDAKLQKMAEDGAVLVGSDGERMPLPVSALTVLARAVHAMAHGQAVTLDSFSTDLSTRRAAELLHVPHHFLVEKLLGTELPFHEDGIFQTIKLKDLLVYRERRQREQLAAIREMADTDQELGIYEMTWPISE